MKTKKILIILVLLIITSLLQAKTVTEAFKQKTRQIVLQIYQGKHKISSRIKKVAILGFYSKNNSPQQNQLGLLLSRYLYEEIDSEDILTLVAHQQVSHFLKNEGAYLRNGAQLVKIGKILKGQMLIQGEILSENQQIIVKINLIKSVSGEVVHAFTTSFNQKIIKDVLNAYHIDKKGKLYQDTFNLNQRFYIGPKWAPAYNAFANIVSDNISLSFGYEAFYLNLNNTNKYQFKMFQGNVDLNPLFFDITLFEFDKTHIQVSPLFWITTFLGQPKRYDFEPDGGWGLKVGRVQYHPLQSKKYSHLEAASFYIPVPLWQGVDMMSFFRLRLGVGCGGLFDEKNETLDYEVLPKVALDAHFILDKKGWHNLKIGAEAVFPYNLTKEKQFFTAEASASYEFIFMRISEQPVSLFLQTTAQYRNDIPDSKENWQVKGLAGINFSFDVPPFVTLISELEYRREAN